MHNNIMAAGSRDRPPMLATGRYAQWQSRFMRYVDTNPNSKELKKCILHGPYVMTEVIVPAQPATENTPAIPTHKVPKTFKNITPENHAHFNSAHFDAEAEAIHMILSGIGDDIYSTVDAYLASEEDEDSDPEQAQRDKDMQKNLALIAKYIKNIYKPTNNNLRIFSNTRNKNVDNSTRHRNDNQSRQFGNQRTIIVAKARETVGNQVVQQTGTQCFYCKEFGHFAKECRKPKRVKDYAYHKEKMMLCKQEEKGVPLIVEHSEWLNDTDEDPDEQ
ncbi:retrovirus-related pol polyprotein from transposon TNT 1-94 [Tanacetum coccineum]